MAFGVLGSIGGFVVISKVALELGSSLAWSIPVMMALSGALVGAVMARATPLRPLREPALGATLGTGLFVAIVLAGTLPPAWMVALGVPPPLVAAGLAALVGAAAAGGAALALRFPVAATPTTAWVLTASTLVTGGAIGIAVAFVESVGKGERDLVLFASMFVMLVLAGFVTQLVVRARRPWACASGVVLLIVLNALGPGHQQGIPAALAGSVICALFGTVGARLAWRMKVMHELEDAPEVPAARTRAT